jgi:ABC-2 type transport system permease protein
MTAMDGIRLYCRYVGISVRAQLQYRASTAMLAVGHLLVTGIEFLAIWALFDRFGTLRGWSLPQVALLYGMANSAMALAEGGGRGFDTLGSRVKAGTFDRLLLRPRSTALQVAGQELQLLRVGRLLQGLAVLAWAIWSLGLTWSPAQALLLGGAVLGGACLFAGLFVLQGTMSFWTIESLEIVNTVTYGGVETAQYPLAIYATWFRRFFTYVIPLACLNYFPALALTDVVDPLGTPRWVPWISPLVGVAFLLVSLLVWRMGVRHYTSTGS